MSAALAVVLAVALATIVLAHVALVLGLIRRREFARAALAFVVPPLAPIYGVERGMRALASVWLAGLVLYAVVLAFT
jgi:hypothetical protein